MYDFMYVYPQTIPGEDNFPDTRIFTMNYKKISIPGLVPNIWLGFSYISSEDYELDKNFDGTELKNNQTTHPTINLDYFLKVLWLLSKNGLMI